MATRMIHTICAVIGISLLSGASAALGSDVIKIGAGAAPTENVLKKIQEPMEKAIGVKIVIVDNGPFEALVDLDKGKLDAATGGVSFPDWMKMMEEKGYAIPDKGAYKHRVIGKDLIKVVIHKGVTVGKLDKEQLKSIFTGKIKNWKEVGGGDVPIKVVYGMKIPGTQSVFQKQIMDGAAYTKESIEATNAPDVKEKVKGTPGAVGLSPLTLVDGSVNAPEILEIGRPITFITKGEPSPAVVKMLDFIRGEGKKYLAN